MNLPCHDKFGFSILAQHKVPCPPFHRLQQYAITAPIIGRSSAETGGVRTRQMRLSQPMTSLFIHFGLLILFLSPAVAFRAMAAADELSAARIPFSLRHSATLPNGTIQLSVDSVPDGLVAIQSSTNLLDWTQGKVLAVEGGSASFNDPNPSADSRKFYRAVRVLRVSGTAREAGSDKPIPHAPVTLTFSNPADSGAATLTDEIGGFELFAVPPSPQALFQVSVTAAGYTPFLDTATAHGQQLNFPDFDPYLTPADLPPNDHFYDREAIEGINITFSGTTTNATRQSGDPILGVTSDVAVPQGNTIWWTWTAPADAVVSITANHSVAPGMIAVFQGGLLHQLNLLWESVHGDDGFFVQAGRRYQIVFASQHAGQVELAIEETTPTRPVIRDFPGVPPWVAATFWVKAEGTRPFQYQWHKDGEPIPGATGPFLSLDPLTFDDVGSYTVEVRNEAGSILSDEAEITGDHNANDLLMGTWDMDVRFGPYLGDYIATFHEDTFTLTRASDSSPAGEGTYTVTRVATEYRLEMRYANPFSEDIDSYKLTHWTPEQIYFSGTVSNAHHSHPAGGILTRR